MIIEDERGEEEGFDYKNEDNEMLWRRTISTVILFSSRSSWRYRRTKNKQTHEQLREDLVEHLHALWWSVICDELFVMFVWQLLPLFAIFMFMLPEFECEFELC
jgi:hypothetical protein